MFPTDEMCRIDVRSKSNQLFWPQNFFDPFRSKKKFFLIISRLWVMIEKSCQLQSWLAFDFTYFISWKLFSSYNRSRDMRAEKLAAFKNRSVQAIWTLEPSVKSWTLRIVPWIARFRKELEKCFQQMKCVESMSDQNPINCFDLKIFLTHLGQKKNFFK